ncbi:MAG TPA: HAMP domain-containing sensor histidine kinase, partial [Myxococcota bacterium]|nr:HAMP domain-containing sensor histidine kinase [Myxococcota bacterium]
GAAGAASLVWITTALDRAAEGIFAVLDGMRGSEELKLRLLLHARSGDPVVREHLEDRLRTLARGRQPYTSGEDERVQLREVQVALERYLEGREGPPAERDLATAFAAVDQLADRDAERARALRAQSSRLDTWANWLGGATAILLALGIPLVLVWLRLAIVRPVLQLREGMERYARGDRTARASLPRPRELREIGERFNELADALARKRQEEMAFLGAVAHDIRNPLSVLANSLASLGARPLDAQTERLFAVLGRQVEQIGRLVADLLDAAQLEATQLPLRMETCDLRQSAQQVADLLSLRPDGERVELRLAEEPILVHGDPSRLHQALANVVGNALKYSPKESAVRVAVQRASGAAEVSVTDHGPGISPADRAALFEPFRRAAGADRIGPGAGLGLFISDRIVRAHGGRIELESEPGAGSTFRLLFPPAKPARATRERP